VLKAASRAAEGERGTEGGRNRLDEHGKGVEV
jgi:hypothetical protein